MAPTAWPWPTAPAPGGLHLRAYPISHEILRKPVPTDRFSFSGKARIITIAEDSNAAIDSLVACKFSFFGASLEEYAELLTAATGVGYSPQRLKEIGTADPAHRTLLQLRQRLFPQDDPSPNASSVKRVPAVTA